MARASLQTRESIRVSTVKRAQLVLTPMVAVWQGCSEQHRLRRLAMLARVAEFTHVNANAKFTFGDACTCGRNHRLLIVGDNAFCPVLFYLGLAQAKQVNDGGAALQEWAREFPITKLLKRLDSDKDACYEEENK